jgi:ubiquinone biosynthesis protein UbiJ
MISVSASLAINHLLKQQGWARERLAQHTGSRLEFRAAPLPAVRLEITPAGLVSAAGGEPADLTVTINPMALPLFAMRSPRGLDYVEMAGPEALAETVRKLLAELQWDFEEDLSHVIGDVAAHGLAQAGREAYSWPRNAGERLARNFSEYWTEEQPLLARRADFDRFARELQELEAGLARAQARLLDIRPAAPEE